MPGQAGERAPALSGESLEELLAVVISTRAARDDLRGQRSLNPQVMLAARQVSLQALEEYAAALNALRWPIPRSIQQDLQLQRSLCGGPVRSRPRTLGS